VGLPAGGGRASADQPPKSKWFIKGGELLVGSTLEPTRPRKNWYRGCICRGCGCCVATAVAALSAASMPPLPQLPHHCHERRAVRQHLMWYTLHQSVLRAIHCQRETRLSVCFRGALSAILTRSSALLPVAQCSL